MVWPARSQVFDIEDIGLASAPEDIFFELTMIQRIQVQVAAKGKSHRKNIRTKCRKTQKNYDQ